MFVRTSSQRALRENPWSVDCRRRRPARAVGGKIDALKALGFHDFDFYQTLLKNPMYTNEDVEDVVPGYQSGGYVAIIAHK